MMQEEKQKNRFFSPDLAVGHGVEPVFLHSHHAFSSVVHAGVLFFGKLPLDAGTRRWARAVSGFSLFLGSGKSFRVLARVSHRAAYNCSPCGGLAVLAVWGSIPHDALIYFVGPPCPDLFVGDIDSDGGAWHCAQEGVLCPASFFGMQFRVDDAAGLAGAFPVTPGLEIGVLCQLTSLGRKGPPGV